MRIRVIRCSTTFTCPRCPLEYKSLAWPTVVGCCGSDSNPRISCGIQTVFMVFCSLNRTHNSQTSNLAKEFHLALFEASPGPVFAARFVRCSSYADELTVHGNKGRRWDVHPVSA